MIGRDRIDAILQDAINRQVVAGVVAMAADADGVIYQGASGVRLLGEQAPMTTDTVFAIASMTKAITATAAMQLVEQGYLTLDEPLGRFAKQLAEPQILEGFDASGVPRLRPATQHITLRHLMTHTAGYTNDIWSANMRRYADLTGLPGTRLGKLAALDAPLVFEPGERWEYSLGIDWVGRIVEAISGKDLETYFRAHLFEPLGMANTSFVPNAAMVARGAGTHHRQADGTLAPTPFQPPSFAEFYPGGGGLCSTGPDYVRFLRAMLNGGTLDGARVLRPETVALMGQNHMGELDVLPMRTANPTFSNDVELFPGMAKKWGLSFLINTEEAPTGRSAGSLCWAGLRNTHFWIDPTKRVAGLLMTQLLPFADPAVLKLLDAFETEIYQAVGA